MMRNTERTFFRCFFGVLLLWQTAMAAEQPNIIFILADDLGWADLPMYGNRFNEAPNLQRMAHEGMLFTDAYAAAPVCSPTRASIQSGQYPARVGITDFIPGHWRPYEKVRVPINRTQYLQTEIPTVAESLKRAGYTTGYFGKWHLGEKVKGCHPLDQGYDEAHVGEGYFKTKFNPPRPQEEDKIVSERLTIFASEFIRKHKQKPFFLFISHWDVHCALDAEKERVEKFLKKPKVPEYPCNAFYAACIAHLDHSVGEILALLKQEGLDEKTLVVFFSDNGGSISENKYPGITEGKYPMVSPRLGVYQDGDPLKYIMTSNVPLRNEKGSVYEGGIRDPLIVRYPGKIKPRSTSHEVVTSVDFYPTFLELANAAAPAGHTLDGVSLLPVLTGRAPLVERAIFWHYPVYHHDRPASALRKGFWKLIENLESQESKLYNLATDIGETTDLSKAYPQIHSALYAELKQWQKSIDAQLPDPNPDFDPLRRQEWGKNPGK